MKWSFPQETNAKVLHVVLDLDIVIIILMLIIKYYGKFYKMMPVLRVT